MKKEIVDMLSRICDIPNVNFETDELLESGVLDSLGLMTLITELCESFDIQIQVDDLEFEDFSNADSIVALVDRLKN